MRDENNAFKFDWGTITPEFYNKEKNSVVHIFNHYLIGEENINRVIRFTIGRIEWYNNYFPQGCTHEVAFDDRGQGIDDCVRNRIAGSLSKHASIIKFASKRG